MKKFKSSFLLVVLMLSSMGTAMATHLIGGYMSYEFLEKINNEYQYKITLFMFRDMEQSDVNFDDEILLGVYLNNANLDRTMVVPVPLLTRKEVKPPGNEQCEYYADKKIQMAFYEKVISLPAYTEGYHITFVRCCRNIQDNLTLDNGKPNQGQTYYCFIPNPALRNSSPRFSGVPSPYMCAKDTTTFLNRAVDKDGDSLVYRIALPFQGGEPTQGGAMPDPPINLKLPISPVIYKSDYNFKNPFGLDGLADINPNNGLTTTYAQKKGSYVVAIEVSEYRNGILLSTVRLDMQILVLDCPPNNKPLAKSVDGNYFEVEAGDKLCVKLQGTNSDAKPQDVTLFATGDILTGENGVKPPLAKMPTTVGSDFTESELCWTPSCDQAREKPYLVTITARDNGCPPKEHNINIEIKVLKFIGSKEIVGPIRSCTGSGYVFNYKAKDPKATSTFWWEVTGGKIIGSKKGSSINVTWTATDVGKIRMVEISQFGCPGDTNSIDITLLPAPSMPIISGIDTVCLNTTNATYSVPNNPGSSYVWKNPNGTYTTSSGASIQVNWNKLGDFKIGAVETNADGCNSDTAWFKVNVRKPTPGIVGPKSVCPNSQGVAYQAIGIAGSSFNWTVAGGTKVSGGISKTIKINWGNEGSGIIDLVETDKFGCVSDVVKYVVSKTYTLAGADPRGDTTVCEFDANVPYDVVEASGSIYRWSVAGGNQISGDSTSKMRVNWGAFGAGKIGVQEWAWDAVNNRECISIVRYLDVTINPIPTADKIEGTFEVCQGADEFSYSLNGFSGSTYRWTVNGNDQDINGQGTSTIQYVWDLPGKFPITVEELSKDSCPGAIIDTFIIVHPKPISDKIEGDLVHCFPNTQNTLYTVKGYPNSTFNWQVQNGTFTGGTNDSIIINWVNEGYGQIKVIEISEYGCKGDSLELPIYINNLQIDLDVVSVGFPDDRMHGSWHTLFDELTSQPYQIEKRVPGAEPAWTSVVQENNLSFLETNLNTDLTPFEYRIVGYDLCGNPRYSEVHTSILLSGDQDQNDFSLSLKFTPYKGWVDGVSKYELYKSVNADRFLRLEKGVFDGEEIVIDGNSDNYRQCFRIKATEQNGAQKESWSNEICFYFQPNVYVPTAFTPNKDGTNDGFHPVSVAVQDYSLAVYNRWGQKVFETQDQSKAWDGRYLDVDSPAGIYMYIVTFTDYEKKVYQKNGTVQLMR